ncbi:MAG TPA: hypothetical protein VFL57_05255 [Bryobacteraceae bacterium]|nr:hypothetical protein [Bryobacteraceae bacterium]
MNRAVAGALSGMAATGPMTLFMMAAHKALPGEEQHPLPPREITMNAAEAAGLREDIEAAGRRTDSTLAAHFGFGMTAGAVYSGFAGATGLPAAAEGALYGLGVWLRVTWESCPHWASPVRRRENRLAATR